MSFLLQPSLLALAAVVLGLWLITNSTRVKAGKQLAWGGLTYLGVAGLSPFGFWLLLPLEQNFAYVPKPKAGDQIAGIIMLGGFEDPWVTAGREMLTMNETGERLSESVRLAHLFPDAKVVFTGGSPSLWKTLPDISGTVGGYLREVGINPGRIVIEGRSRNTIENARFTADIVEPRPEQKWLLVTSAFHMPRAVGMFRRAGFNVLPYAVDFRTRDAGDALRLPERLSEGLRRADLAFNEWLGLVYYRMAGDIDAILPPPR
jgi:uncharacterized SAM-binding protein YcdF (DUF218 family)